MYQFEDIFEAEEQDIKETKSQIGMAVSSAKKCLSSPDFENYKKALEKAQASMLRQMIVFTHAFFMQEHADMAFYGAKMARMVTKLQDLTVLLDNVESDARKDKLQDGE